MAPASEYKLLVMGRTVKLEPFGQQGNEGPQDVIKELLHVRLWPDALTLSEACGFDHSLIFNSHANELLEDAALPASEGWDTLADRLTRFSNAQNNYKYYRTTNAFIFSHSKARKHHPVIPNLLRKVDPSGLLSILLGVPRIGRYIAGLTLEITRDHVYATNSTNPDVVLQQYGFKKGTVLTASVVDRVALLAQSVRDRNSNGPELCTLADEVYRLLHPHQN